MYKLEITISGTCSGLMIPDIIISVKISTSEVFDVKRRSFTKEFKHGAACLVVEQGYTYPEACHSLDLTPTALRCWV